jgi:hypothetical protein
MTDAGWGKLLAAIILAAACAFLIYAGIITFFVNPYIANHTWSQIARDQRVYDGHTGTSGDRIYFIGNSQVVYAVDPALVRESLAGSNLSFQVYSLGVDDDAPLQRLLELQGILDARPKMVIMGYSYTCFSNLTRYVPDDNLALLSGKLRLDPASRSFFSPDQLALIDGNWFGELLFKRKFIIPSIRKVFGIHLQERDNIVNDTMSHEQKLILAKNPYDAFLAPVYPEENVQKEAFLHFARELEAANITLVYVTMPLDPMRSETIPDTTRENFFLFMNGTGVRSFDLEKVYGSADFMDLVHLNRYGREKFSREIGSLILGEVRPGAV